MVTDASGVFESAVTIFFSVCFACCIFVFPSEQLSSMDPDMSQFVSRTWWALDIGVSAIFISSVPNFWFGLSGNKLKLYVLDGGFCSWGWPCSWSCCCS